MTTSGSPKRTRIAPAPSGDVHVGNVRTALYNWVLARQSGGQFILRVEDTDASRASDEAFEAVQEILHWAGLHWDEGPGIGGPYAPYRQSERGEIYTAALAELETKGKAYRCYCTAEELAERNAAARAAKRAPGYDGRCRALTGEERAAFEAQGRTHVMRFAVPPGSTTFHDLVRGDITVAHKEIPDFGLSRSDGGPLYVLAAAVDDIAMGLTDVVRGEDLIAATPRQLLLYAAMDVGPERWPEFGHLPMVIGDDHKPLSKRNGEVSLRWYRDAGFLPEAMMNYLALLGWSLAPDREVFGLDEMIEHFDISRVSHNPARFDIKKLESINGEWIRAMAPAELVARLRPWFADAGLPAPDGLLEAAVDLIQTRMVRLTDAVEQLAFLIVDEDDFVVTDHQYLVAEVLPALTGAERSLEEVENWSAADIRAALEQALLTELGLKPKVAYGPIRIAVTGRRISPPLFESLELLGRERSLARLRDALAEIRGW